MVLKLLSYFFIFIFSSQALCGEKVQTIELVGSEFPYILQKDSNGKISGIAVNILNELEKEMNVKFQVQILPWARALNMVKKNEVDGIIGPYKNTERLDYITFTDQHIYEDYMVFLKRVDYQFTWRGDLNELQGISMAKVKSWAYGDRFDNLTAGAKFNVVNKPEQGILMLEKKRVDLLAFNLRNANYEIHQRNLEKIIEPIFPEIKITKGYFGFSKNRLSDKLIKKFNEKLTKLAAEGVIRDLNIKNSLMFKD